MSHNYIILSKGGHGQGRVCYRRNWEENPNIHTVLGRKVYLFPSALAMRNKLGQFLNYFQTEITEN